MKRIYLITHGDRKYVPNPGHTEKGKEQIRALRPKIPKDLALVVVGTGKRFLEIYDYLFRVIFYAAVEYSPFVGCADSLDKEKNLIMADGTLIQAKKYIGLKRADLFDAWCFLHTLPDRTLLCSGGELYNALGFGQVLPKEKGALYEIDVEQKIIRKL